MRLCRRLRSSSREEMVLPSSALRKLSAPPSSPNSSLRWSSARAVRSPPAMVSATARICATGREMREAKKSAIGSSSSAMSSTENVMVSDSACMPLMISVIDWAMNTAPTTSPKNVMGTATATMLPERSSSVAGALCSLWPAMLLSTSEVRLVRCEPEVSFPLVDRSFWSPICVAISPVSTVGSMAPARLAGRRPTRRPSVCWVRMRVSPSLSTTQTVASHCAVLRPMSGTR